MPPTTAFLQPPPDSTGKKVRGYTIDTDKFLPGSAIADPETAAAVAAVGNAAPGAAAYGLTVRAPEPGSAAMTQPAQDAASSTILAANVNRRGFVIENAPQDDVSDLFLAFGATATTAAYTKKLRPGEAWERSGGYTGVISGIWSAAGGGSAKVTEES